jgi:hypothetical protein
MASVEDGLEFFRQSNDAESENRQAGLTALQFRYGDQWPKYAVASRGMDRPQLTINETNVYIKKVTNAQRQQRPRGRASPVDSFADKKIAKVITGLGRHVEVNSDADNAYDTAFDFAATIGWGYWRVRTDYISEDSFNQDVFIDVIDNPFSVYFDRNSKLPDGSDADGALLTEMMRKDNFKKDYPGAQLSGFSNQGAGDSDSDWSTEHDIRVAEYFYVERERQKLVMLTDGNVLWADEVSKIKGMLIAAGVGVRGERDSFRRKVKWCKQTAFEILEEKDLPGRYIPIVPVYWTNVVIDGKRIRCGLVKDAMDPARMVNFWNTAATESLALAPKAKWLIPEGGDEGHEREYAQANLSANPVLRYKTKGVQGEDIPPPQRIQPEPPPAGLIEATFMATQNLSRVMGVFDPAVRGGAQHKSDKTLNAERAQSENTNFDGYDNLVRSIKHTWRIMLSYFPVVYDTQRVQRIIGEDGREQMVTLNEKKTVDEDGQAIEKVLNDVTVGTYDVVMQTGPGYDTKRQEGAAAMLELLKTPLGEKIAQVGDDLIVRDMDFPGADVLADRLAAANPLAQIDEASEVPPKAQMMIKGLQQQLQQAGQVIEKQGNEIRLRGGIEQMKQDGETKRTLLKETGKVHVEQMKDQTKMHDVEARAVTAQNVAEIQGLVQLLVKHIDTKALEREIASRNEEQALKHSEQTAAEATIQ